MSWMREREKEKEMTSLPLKSRKQIELFLMSFTSISVNKQWNKGWWLLSRFNKARVQNPTLDWLRHPLKTMHKEEEEEKCLFQSVGK